MGESRRRTRADELRALARRRGQALAQGPHAGRGLPGAGRDAHPRGESPLRGDRSRRHPDEKEAWYGLGEARFHGPDGPANRLDALEPFEKAIELDPSFALAYYHLIDLYLQDERYDEGIEKARTFIEQDPENPAWYLAWVRAVVAKGDAAETDATIDEALGLIDDPAMQRQLLHGAAMALEMVNEFDRADALLAQALEIPSEESEAELLVARATSPSARARPARGEKFYHQVAGGRPRERQGAEAACSGCSTASAAIPR